MQTKSAKDHFQILGALKIENFLPVPLRPINGENCTDEMQQKKSGNFKKIRPGVPGKFREFFNPKVMATMYWVLS